MNKNVTAVILIVLAVAIYFTYTSGVWVEVKEVKAVNDQYLSAIDNAQELISLRDQVQKQYNSISIEDREKLDKMLPDTVDNIRLVIDLNNVALQNGLSLKNISAGAKTAGNDVNASSKSFASNRNGTISIPTLDTVNVSFSVSATYQQFISFMQALEANLRIMDITHLSVTANDTGTYDFSVQINTYWLRQ